MANIDELIQNGYFIKDVSPIGDENLASFSLKSSMRSYFQTAEDLTNLLKKPDLGTMTDQEVDKACGPKYAVDACDAITHLQHFLELYVKDIYLETVLYWFMIHQKLQNSFTTLFMV